MLLCEPSVGHSEEPVAGAAAPGPSGLYHVGTREPSVVSGGGRAAVFIGFEAQGAGRPG